MDNNVASLLGTWLLLQILLVLALSLGGLYALFCLSRASASMDRLATAVETWLARDAARIAPPVPGQIPPASTSGITPDWMQPIELPTGPTAGSSDTEAKRD